jgi:hypothetical protein
MESPSQVLAGLKPQSLLISASSVAGITGMSQNTWLDSNFSKALHFSPFTYLFILAVLW